MKKKVKIYFLGASGTVTGSKFLIETPYQKVLIDCGLFQGAKEWREQNWKDMAFDVTALDVVLLTHGHLDHVGYLPRLVKQGFEGKIYGTAPTLAIAGIVLRDSAKIQEEDAERANKEGFSRHHPALPLYTGDDVDQTLQYTEALPRDRWTSLSADISFRFRYNGHILGAVFIEMDIYGKRFVFSGDIGRPGDPLLFDPVKPERAEYLFVESTYGDRIHPGEDVQEVLAQLIREAIHKRGNLIIPSFAVERAQVLIYLLWKMYKKNRIPHIPVFIDSPMGEQVLQVFSDYPDWQKVKQEEFRAALNHVEIVASYRETWNVIDNAQPKIVIAGSGMVSGGRVLTYLSQLIDEENTTVLLVGFQAEGTRGRDLKEGAGEIKFFGKYYPVRARIECLDSLSAHADQRELLDWLSEIRGVPEKVFLIHGEPESARIFGEKIKERYSWDNCIPEYNGSITLWL
ncbi:MBL fold metallo-hydrolase RNA specificity domain-containing protein [Sinomicrobium soli]|uniref:MBL fold metallo-hydrolase RNA specificity domain-containing protein n=1 Tax=Sinomicrobium sp. N-1-3-6 TaxID=2219864 RepID=UPI000DCEC84F|nr:MBL fold metallo-hydrolase [Sinomicrobium sp. N-1-3-6]RAV29167.1 MBL fold metallo-hydrolase [Sinomicrobium sp. N-1-3-6]